MSTDLDSLSQQLVAGVCVPFVEGQAEGGGSSEGEVGAGETGRSVGVLQLSTQFQTCHLGRHVASAHLHRLAVVRDHLLLLLHTVVHDAELGTEK